ncbi:MAG: sugar ABC transporter permease [Spirochaetaceae bacterium]|nr:MAG: sugar ABC transporter permease [Spirochaetaceae bacterium]
MQPHLATGFRFILVLGGVVGLMVVVQRLLLLLRVRREAATGYALITPWLVGFLVFTSIPMIASAYLSLTDYNILQPPTWVGLENFRRIFNRDIDFGPAIRITLLYAFLSVPIGVAGALFIAMLLANDLKGIGVYRTIYYLPTVLPEVAVALLWRWIFNPQAGLLNRIIGPVFRIFGMSRPDWFGDPTYVLPAFVIISLWGITGVNMVIFLAALKNVPTHLYEVAFIDGAGSWRRFWSITIPMVSPVIFLQVVRGIIGALQIFTVYAFTNPTPRAGKFMSFYIYQTGFQQFRMGYASALAWILFSIILALTLVVLRSSEMWVYYEGERK